MTTSSSPSRLSLAAFIMALITSPQGGTSFPISRIGVPQHHQSHDTSCQITRRAPPLHSTVTPTPPMRPMEENHEKNSNKTAEDAKGEWKQVVGGFVPRFLKRDDGATTEAPRKRKTIEMVDTLEDYKRVVVDEPDQIVVVRFFAPWCKSCKAAMPLFKKMVHEHSGSNVKFVEVPLRKDTAYIHEGLGVPSVPFGHVYHPDVGLVEEKKINKKVFKEFRSAVDSYVRGSCDLPMEEGEDEENSLESYLLIDDDGFQ